MTAKPRKPLLVNLTWTVGGVLALAILYVLSYAPVYRLAVESAEQWVSRRGLAHDLQAGKLVNRRNSPA
jgi:hypothetical protein